MENKKVSKTLEAGKRGQRLEKGVKRLEKGVRRLEKGVRSLCFGFVVGERKMCPERERKRCPVPILKWVPDTFCTGHVLRRTDIFCAFRSGTELDDAALLDVGHMGRERCSSAAGAQSQRNLACDCTWGLR